MTMRAFRNICGTVRALVLGLSVALWSVAPAAGHAPIVFETIHDHLETIESHGHAHGSLAEDIYWAMHGHSHDAADHDHSPAILLLVRRTVAVAPVRDAWRFAQAPPAPSRSFRIERPPRA